MLIGHGCSRQKACAIVGIPGLYYRRWKKLVAKVDDMNSAVEFMARNTTGSTCRIHPRQKSFLSQSEPELEHFVFQLHEQSIQLTNQMVGREAACILPVLKEETTRAKELLAHHFTHSVGLTHHLATHMAQKHFSEMEVMQKTYRRDEGESGREKSRRHPKYGPDSNSIFVP